MWAGAALAGSTGVVWRGASGATDFTETLDAALYPSAVLWMPMNVNAWPVEDGSQARYDAVQGNATLRPTFSDDRGGSMLFDGGDYFVFAAATKHNFGAVTNFTIMARIKLNSVGVYHAIVDKRGTTGSPGFLLGVNNANKLLGYAVDNAAHSVSVAGATTLSTGVWYHVAAVFARSGNVVVYVNGVQDGSASMSAVLTVDNAEYSYVGYRAQSGSVWSYFSGRMDDVCIIASALSSNVVRAIAGP
jgi:hypothetical protein